jgi:hypothetical protein
MLRDRCPVAPFDTEQRKAKLTGRKAALFDVEQTSRQVIGYFQGHRLASLEEERSPMTLSAIQMEHWVNKQKELDHLLQEKANLKVEAKAPKELMEARLIGLNKRIVAAQTIIQAYESQSKIP